MKISAPAKILPAIVLTLAVCGWRNHRRMEALRMEQAELIGQAATRGIHFDPARPQFPPRRTKSERADRAADARRAAAELIAYVEEMTALGLGLYTPDQATRRRMADQMDRIMALDGAQLKILIDELRADVTTRGDLIHFAIGLLLKDRPQDALAILTDSPEMLELARRPIQGGLTSNAISESLRNWAALNPTAALDWFRENGDKLGPFAGSAKAALVFSIAEKDTAAAAGLIRESNDAPGRFLAGLNVAFVTPEQRLSLLALVQEYEAGSTNRNPEEPAFIEELQGLLLGSPWGSNNDFADFDFSTGWMDANLSADRIEAIMRHSGHRLRKEDHGRWIEWIGGRLPTDSASDEIRHLSREWTQRDPRGIAAWLDSSPDGPGKEMAIRAYAETLAAHDPRSAARWAETLPPGSEREATLVRIHQDWPKDEPAEAAAAAAFAAEHGIE